MGLNLRQIPLTGNGSGTIWVPPSYLAGHRGSGPYALTAKGDALATGGTQLTRLTKGTEVFVEGEIRAAGPNNGSVTLYLDF